MRHSFLGADLRPLQLSHHWPWARSEWIVLLLRSLCGIEWHYRPGGSGINLLLKINHAQWPARVHSRHVVSVRKWNPSCCFRKSLPLVPSNAIASSNGENPLNESSIGESKLVDGPGRSRFLDDAYGIPLRSSNRNCFVIMTFAQRNLGNNDQKEPGRQCNRRLIIPLLSLLHWMVHLMPARAMFDPFSPQV
jgi:hypothetical protein